MYSEIEAKRNKKGWVRNGTEVCYYQNSIKRKGNFHFYTLTWTVTFKHDYDTVYFTHSYPYTYSDLRRYLTKIENDHRTKDMFERKMLCQTLAGNPCDLLTVTNF